MIYEDDVSLGISVFLPSLSFGVEISRPDIKNFTYHLEKHLVEVPDDQKIGVIINNIIAPKANEIVKGVCKDINEGTIDIALNFAYIFHKIKNENIDYLRGMVFIINEAEQLMLEGYHNNDDYVECLDIVKKTYQPTDVSEDDDIDMENTGEEIQITNNITIH